MKQFGAARAERVAEGLAALPNPSPARREADVSAWSMGKVRFGRLAARYAAARWD